MRFIPINDVTRKYVSTEWNWRYLRGIQCVLLATHGMVSPNPKFYAAAFGKSYQEFLEILAMPDRYIIHREKYMHNEAADWLRRFRKLPSTSKSEVFNILELLNGSRDKKEIMAQNKKYLAILEHYYPGGNAFRE
jgi:hypothetical protein